MLLVSSIAGVIVHIPAGIGVLEAVFIALLAGEHVSHGTIIAALLAYRMLYYFLRWRWPRSVIWCLRAGRRS